MLDSLWPHELQHARIPCSSLSPGVCSNSCPLSQWCHLTILSSVAPFSSCPQSFPASWSFPVSQLFASGSQSIGASASALVHSSEYPRLISFPDWFDFLNVQGTLKILLQDHSLKVSILQQSASPWSNSHIHTWLLENHSFDYAMLCYAKSLQSCPTLCDPIDSSPPGSVIPGILQARILEWVAISFSSAWKEKSESEVTQSRPTLSDLMDCSLPGSSVHGIFQARVLEWGAIAFSKLWLYGPLLAEWCFCFLICCLGWSQLFKSTRLLLSWLQPQSRVILEPKKIKSLIVSPSICHGVMGLDAKILVF